MVDGSEGRFFGFAKDVLRIGFNLAACLHATAADYFAPFAQHLSADEFYTSDYDLSAFSANQYGFGVTYTDVFTKFHLGKFGLKSVDLKYNTYARNSSFSSSIISGGFKFVMY